jgi:cytochrome c553
MQMIRKYSPTVLSALAGIGAIAAAPPRIDAAKIVHEGSDHGAPACVSCHGPSLGGSPDTGAPAIAGKPSAFIVARLDHYASPQGHNAAMRQVATALSPEERAAVAKYISSLPPPAAR